MKQLLIAVMFCLSPGLVSAQIPGNIIPFGWDRQFYTIKSVSVNEPIADTRLVNQAVQIQDLSHNLRVYPVFKSCPKVNEDGRVFYDRCYSHSEIRGQVKNRSNRTFYNLVIEVQYGDSYFNKWQGSQQIRLLPSEFRPGVQGVVNERILDSLNSQDVKLIGVFEQQ